MQNEKNQRVYQLWAPIYDLIFQPPFSRARQRSVQLLELEPGERLLIPGIGTGLDCPLIPEGVNVVGGDLSQAMLARARTKAAGREITLHQMDAQALSFAHHTFDAVLLSLILSVVPDGAAAFQEAWRVLRPGGRMLIFDKFLPQERSLSWGRHLLGCIVRGLGTDPNRRLQDIIGNTAGVRQEVNEPSLLGGSYRIIRLRKASGQANQETWPDA